MTAALSREQRAASGEHPVLLVDIGGSKLAVAVGREGAIAKRVRIDGMGAVHTPERLVDLVISAAHRVGWNSAGSVPGRVAVAVPGTIDRSGRRIVGAANLPLQDFPLADELASRLGALSVVLEDDANCGVLGEHAAGAAQGQDDVTYVSLSTGVGMGSIVAGTLVAGAHRQAGEIGHMVVVPGGRPCGCGRSGCLEAYFSGRALAAAGEEALNRGEAPALRTRAGWLTGRDVIEAAYSGDSCCLALVHDGISHLVHGVQALCAVLDPAVLVFGGGLMKSAALADDVLDRVRGGISASVATDFALTMLGDDGVLLGALTLTGSL